eukprot:UN21460
MAQVSTQGASFLLGRPFITVIPVIAPPLRNSLAIEISDRQNRSLTPPHPDDVINGRSLRSEPVSFLLKTCIGVMPQFHFEESNKNHNVYRFQLTIKPRNFLF